MQRERFNQLAIRYQARRTTAQDARPWDLVQLTKAERKGRKPDQIRELRERKYREAMG